MFSLLRKKNNWHKTSVFYGGEDDSILQKLNDLISLPPMNAEDFATYEYPVTVLAQNSRCVEIRDLCVDFLIKHCGFAGLYGISNASGNVLRLKLYEEQSESTVLKILSAFENMPVRDDVAGGEVNYTFSKSLIKTLVCIFNDPRRGNIREGVFQTLVTIWDIDLHTTEQLVRSAISDENPAIKNMAERAIRNYEEDYE